MIRASSSLLFVVVLGGVLAGSHPLVRAADAAAGFALQDTPGESLEVRLDGRPVARYMYAYRPESLHDTYKPFLHVMDEAGQQPITKGPGGFYTHHRGIFIGWSRLTVGGKAYDLWGMGGGVQVHQEFRDQQAGPAQASFTSRVAWNTKRGEPLLEEERSFVFHRPAAPALVLVDFIATLKAVAGDTVFNGDPEHAGIHYRPANELDKTKTRYVFPAEGHDPRQDKDLAWAAETYVLGARTYSVVQMNHPDNPPGTMWSAYRDYGRFGAFPKHELAQGQTLTVRYRFWVLAGPLPARDQVQQQYQAFVQK